jgi:hypothetical protein
VESLIEAHLESVRRRLVESVPELGTFLADFCREVTKRFLWFRAVEVRDARSLGRLQSRFARLVSRAMELYAKPPDLNTMLSEVCGSLVLEPSEVAGSLKLLEYEVPFGRASVYVNNAYSYKAEGAILRIVLRGVVSASVDSYIRPVGFRGFEVHVQT